MSFAKKRKEFKIYDNEFVPYLLPDSNKSKQHLLITKEIYKIAHKIYGIDVQSLNFPELHDQNSNYIKTKFVEHNILDSWNKATKEQRENGILNAKIILSIVNDFKKSEYKLFYIGHNKHISNMINKKYKSYLIKLSFFFISLALKKSISQK